MKGEAYKVIPDVPVNDREHYYDGHQHTYIKSWPLEPDPVVEQNV
jgi:hypothetical protein